MMTPKQAGNLKRVKSITQNPLQKFQFKSTITEMKTSLYRLSSRFEMANNQKTRKQFNKTKPSKKQKINSELKKASEICRTSSAPIYEQWEVPRDDTRDKK